MKTLKLKQLLTLGEDNYYSRIGSTHVFYDYFSKNDTLVYKYNKHILPILKGLKDIFPNHVVWAKESVPLWCNGFVYKIYFAKDDDSLSDLQVGLTNHDMYFYQYNENEVLKEKKYDHRNIKELIKDIKELYNINK